MKKNRFESFLLLRKIRSTFKRIDLKWCLQKTIAPFKNRIVRLSCYYAALTAVIIFYNYKFPDTGCYHSIDAALKEPSKVLRLVPCDRKYEQLPDVFDKFPNLKELDLSHHKLYELPPSIASLKKLEKLNLSHNKLYKFPKLIAQLTRLKSLNMAYNYLEVLPENFGNLARLEYLNLKQNQLESLPESLADLWRLKELYLQDNALMKLPQQIGNLKHLAQLTLLGNRLESLPESFTKLKLLKRLDLSRSNLTKLPKKIGDMVNLRAIHLAGNKLTALPESICKLSKLTELTLHENNLEYLPENIGNLKALEILTLSYNRLKTLPASIKNLIGLKTLEISHNQLSSLPDRIGEMDALETVLLDNNELYILPASIGNLYLLKYLNIANNKLESLPNEIGNLYRLESIDFSNNHVSTIPEAWAKLGELRSIKFDDNAVTHIPDKICRLPMLKGIFYQNNLIERDVYAELSRRFSRLFKKYASQKQDIVHQSVKEAFAHPEEVFILSLREEISEGMADSISKFINLRQFTCEQCAMTAFPEFVFSLPHLKELNLTANEIKNLPETLGNIHDLNKLILTNNRITHLPKESLSQLKVTYLDLSQNPLGIYGKSIELQSVNVKELNLSRTGLTACPKFHGEEHLLSSLNLSYNDIQYIDPSILNLKTLTSLDFTDNLLSSVPEFIVKMPALFQLNLQDNDLTTLPYTFKNFSSLSSLNIERNNIDEKELLYIRHKLLPKITVLFEHQRTEQHIYSYYNSSDIPRHRPHRVTYEGFNIAESNNDYYNSVQEPAGKLLQLAAYPNLKELDIEGDISKIGTELLALRKLEHLKLSCSREHLKDSWFNLLLHIPRLKTLSVNIYGVSTIPAAFYRMQGLERLEFNGNFSQEEINRLKKVLPNVEIVS